MAVSEPQEVGVISIDSGCVVAGCAYWMLSGKFSHEDFLDAYLETVDAGNGHLPMPLPGQRAVVCASGFGDGRYGVEAEYDEDGRPARVIIEFIADEDVSS